MTTLKLNYTSYYNFFVLNLAIWNEHQTKIDVAHKLLRSAQDKLEEQIKMRKEQVCFNIYILQTNCQIHLYLYLGFFFRTNN